MPMKILLYSANFAPEPTGIGKYSGEMAAWLAGAGHEVRVVAAPPYYPDWAVAASHRGKWYSRETYQGAEVWRAPLWVPARPTGLTRIVHLMTFAISSFPVILRHAFWRPDVVLTVAPAFVCAPGGWLTARVCGAKAWLHVQDFEIDVAFRLGLMKGKVLRWVVQALESWIFRRFDRVSTISGRMMERALSKKVAEAAVVYFPNWVDIDHIRPLQHPSPYRKELGLPDDAVVALYSGSLGGKQGLMMLPQAAARLAHLKQLYFVICGDGVLKAELEAVCADLPNTRLLPLQPAERLSELLGMADIHLLPQSSGAEDMVMPSKLSGMLASGRPTIATCRAGTEIANVLAGCGVVVPPEDVEAFADAIAGLVAQPERRAVMGRQAREYVERHLSLDAVLSRILGSLVTLSGEPPIPHWPTKSDVH